MATPSALLSILLAFTLVAAACSSDDGDAPTVEGAAATIVDGDCESPSDTELTVYSGRSEDLMSPVFEAFECETGIQVVGNIRYAGSTDLALLMETEGDRTPADVFISQSPGPIGFLENAGLLGTVDGDTLDLVEDQNHSDEGTWVGFSGRKRVLVYNVDAYDDADLPTSVFDLTDPQFADRVGIPPTNGSFGDWFTVFRDQFGDDIAAQWLSDMVANGAQPYPNNRSIVDAASRGEIDMGLVNHYYNYQEALANGDSHRAANHDFSSQDIGSLLIITAASVTSSTDDESAAQELVAYLLSEPVQRYLTDETFEYPLAAGVDPAEILPPLEALSQGTVDFEVLADGFERTTEIIAESGILTE